MNKLLFWKTFIKYLTIGLSALVLFAVINQSAISDITRRGPGLAAAQMDDQYPIDPYSYIDGNQYPIDDNQYPIDQYPNDPYSYVDGNQYPSYQYPIDPYTYVDGNQYPTDPYTYVDGNQYPISTAQAPYITYEGGDCWSNESWWVRDWSDGNREWLANHGVVPGECGNPYQDIGVQDGGQWIQLDPECDWNSQQVYDVQWNNVTGEYNRYNYHFQPGACGYQPSYGQYSVKFICEGNYSECGNNVGTPYSEQWGTYMSVYDPYPGCNKTVQVDTFTKYCRDGSGTWICGPNDLVNFNVWYSGVCQVPEQPVYQQPVYQQPVYPTPQYPIMTPVYYPPQQPPYYPPAPVPYLPLPPQQPQYPVYQRPINCNIDTQYCNQATGTYFQNYGYLSGIQCITQSFNTGISCVSQPVTVPVPPPQQPAVQVPNIYNYPGSYSNAYKTQEQTVNAPPQPQVQYVPQVVQQQPQVAGTSMIKQLPSTGLPLLAWAAASFIPIGLKFRKFAKGKLENGIGANYIWEEKQFKMGS